MVGDLVQAGYTVIEHHVARRARAYGAGMILLIGIVVGTLVIPPFGFPRGIVVEIPEGASSSLTSELLEDQHLVNSAFLFKALARLTGVEDDIRAGKYYFAEPAGLLSVVWRLGHGISGIETISVTFPEGITIREMGDILHTRVPQFEEDTFLLLAEPYEGYLFPDTYQFYPDVTPEEVIERMRTRFTEIWEEVETETAGNRIDESQERIVIMASLLEKETKVGPDRAVVAGILWDRIEIGMPLQVDAVFGYIHGIATYHPDLDDLEVESPYNTYRNRDLPPGPIGNPGKDALIAALVPTPSPYVYYLTGTDNLVHYAETFDEHKANKEAYLR